MTRHIITLLLVISLNAFGQDNFKREVDSVYNFHPHELSEAEQQEKTPALDTFFVRVKSDTAKYLPLLRRELMSNDHFPYFYFDCSHLLMISSNTRADKELAAQSFSKCALRDIDPKFYVIFLQSLANDNINITKAAVKILEDSTFRFYLPAHVMYFIQGYCLTYCLLPLNPDLYVDTLITIFQKTKDVTAQKSIITTLWFTYSCTGDKFLQSLNESNSLNKEVADYAHRLLASDFIDKDYKKMLKKMSSKELNEMRKSALGRFSDEAIDDLDFVTKASRQKLSCR